MSFRFYGDAPTEGSDRLGAFAAQSAYEAGGGVSDAPQSNEERKGAAYSITAGRSHDYSGQEQPTYANGRTKKG